MAITIYELKPRFQSLLRPLAPIVVGLLVWLNAQLGPMVGAARRYDGPMGKSDRAFVFGALGLYAGLGGTLPESAWWIMPATAALIAMNIITRVRRGVAQAGAARGGSGR